MSLVPTRSGAHCANRKAPPGPGLVLLTVHAETQSGSPVGSRVSRYELPYVFRKKWFGLAVHLAQALGEVAESRVALRAETAGEQGWPVSSLLPHLLTGSLAGA